MAYEWEPIAWQDGDGNRHEGVPTDLNDTYGVLVHWHDTSDEDTDEYAWVFTPGPLGEWDEWDALIGIISDEYSFELA